MALQKDYKFVAAIKLGSAYSGYAYSFYDDFTQNPLKIGTYPWTLCGRDDATQKTASSILFTSDGTFKNFGYNAEENYNCEQGDLFFHRFPQNNTVLDENSMLTAKSGNKMPALDIYAAAIEYLTDHLTSKIHNRIYSIPDDKKLWTLIDTHSECKNKDFLIKAARKAGIDGEIGVVQKTDAAVGYYMCACRCRGEKFSPKSDYLIIDATAQLITITHFPVRTETSLSNKGGDTVNECIKSFLETITGSENLDCTGSNMSALKAEIEFQKRKMKPSVKKDVCIDLRHSCSSNVSTQQIARVFRGTPYAGKITIQNDKLQIDYDVIQKVFSDSAEGIVKKINEFINAEGMQDIKDILMIGGYSESLFLQTAIQKSFPGKKIHVPVEAGIADLKGAAIGGYIQEKVEANLNNQRKLQLSISGLIDSMKVRTQKARNIRVIVVGQEGVGKSSLCKNLMKENVPGDIASTNGIDIFIQRFSIDLQTKAISKLQPGAECDNVIKRLCNMLAAEDSKQEDENSLPKPEYTTSVSTSRGRSKVSPVRSRLSSSELVKQREVDEDDITPLVTAPVEHSESLTRKSSKRKLSSSMSIDEFDTDELQRLFQRIESVDDTHEKEAFMSLWDCGGQESFYNTHHIFFSGDAVYLIVLNMKECMGPNKKQAIDRLQYWVRSVGTYAAEETYHTPPVLLIGTHLDEIEGTEEEVRAKVDNLQDALCELPDIQCMKGNIQGFYDVDNTVNDSKMYDEILREIINAAEFQAQWEKVIPAKWLILEEAMMRKKAEGVKVLTLEEVQVLDRTSGIPVNNQKEIKLFLRYMHSTGLILYFGEENFHRGQNLSDTIILDVQWLANAFRCIITAPNFTPVSDKALVFQWRMYRKTAKLDEEFLHKVWQLYDEDRFAENQKILVSFMERLGLIAQPKPEKVASSRSKKPTYYLVPSMLEHSDCQEMPTDFNNKFTVRTRTLCLVFKERFVPFPVFDKLIAACIENYVVIEDTKTFLRKGFGVFKIDGLWSLVVSCCHNAVRLAMYKRTPLGYVEPGVGIKVRIFIEDALKQIIDLYKHRNLEYDYHLQCRIDCDSSHSTVPKCDLESHGYVPCCGGKEPVFLAKRELRHWFSYDDNVMDSQDSQDDDDIQLTSEVLDRVPTNDEITKLALRLGSDYLLLFHDLNMTTEQTQQVHLQYKEESIRTKFFYLFKAWMKNEGEKSTIRRIVRSMKRINMDITGLGTVFSGD